MIHHSQKNNHHMMDIPVKDKILTVLIHIHQTAIGKEMIARIIKTEETAIHLRAVIKDKTAIMPADMTDKEPLDRMTGMTAVIRDPSKADTDVHSRAVISDLSRAASRDVPSKADFNVRKAEDLSRIEDQWEIDPKNRPNSCWSIKSSSLKLRNYIKKCFLCLILMPMRL